MADGRCLANARSADGTIEQVYLSPLPSWLVTAGGRVIAALIETLILHHAGAVTGLTLLPAPS